ncbi:MAG: hypothetical protein OEW45_22080 [Deltaproteobacteria bacterium]|nr:hypothetical protein [Deltaproteobacteria bacterium]
MIKELIRCTACNQVIPNYGGFELGRADTLPGVEWNNADLARVKDFLTAHRGHPMEKLFIKTDSCISEKPSYELMRVTYFFAESAERKFLVRRTKTALDQPAFYEIFPGRLQIFNKSLKIQEDDLGKQIAADKELSLVPKEKVQRFIQAFREEVASISLEALGEVAESIEEGETPLQAYGSLKESVWERILDRCRWDFKESELAEIRRFIDENREPPDVLSLQILRRISVISLVEAESGVDLRDREEIEEVMETRSSSLAEKKVEKGRF